MKVILNKDVDKIGKAGTLVQVKEGFARNFLFPHHLAEPATDNNLKKLEEARQLNAAHLAKIKAESLELKKRLSALSLTIAALTQSGEKLYGSIHAHDISEALKDKGFVIEKSTIDLAEPIKALGLYEIGVKLHPEVVAIVKVSVVKK